MSFGYVRGQENEARKIWLAASIRIILGPTEASFVDLQEPFQHVRRQSGHGYQARARGGAPFLHWGRACIECHPELKQWGQPKQEKGTSEIQYSHVHGECGKVGKVEYFHQRRERREIQKSVGSLWSLQRGEAAHGRWRGWRGTLRENQNSWNQLPCWTWYRLDLFFFWFCFVLFLILTWFCLIIYVLCFLFGYQNESLPRFVTWFILK